MCSIFLGIFQKKCCFRFAAFRDRPAVSYKRLEPRNVAGLFWSSLHVDLFWYLRIDGLQRTSHSKGTPVFCHIQSPWVKCPAGADDVQLAWQALGGPFHSRGQLWNLSKKRLWGPGELDIDGSLSIKNEYVCIHIYIYIYIYIYIIIIYIFIHIYLYLYWYW